MVGRRWILGTACGFAALATASAGDWPQWRGPTSNNKVVDFKVPATWPAKLSQKWKTPVGNGVSCPVLAGDKVYAFARVDGDEVITCLDANTGNKLWSDKFPAKAPNPPAQNFPGPRATPAVGDGYVVTFGVEGTISCYDAATGKLAWRKENTGKPRFSTAASPLIADGLAVVFVGGDNKGALTAYDLKTGEPKWKWTGEGAMYGSPVLATIDGTKQVVTLAARSLAGVAFADGKLLWKTPFTSQYNSGTPVVDGDTIYVSAQRMGTIAFKITKDGDKFTAKQEWKKPFATTNYNSPILKDGLLYALAGGGGGGMGGGGRGGRGGGGGRGGRGGGGGGGRGMGGGAGVPNVGSATLTCLDAKTGDTKWKMDTPLGDCGEVFDVGSYLLALTNKSELIAFKPSDKAFEEVAKYKVSDSATWAAPIITGNRIFVKDKDSVILWTVE
ncbi:MAG TPA: PQQ-binding-like beta-propeller repeat protein [Fimbriiglobus sp.]|jgi:outer membrane protein assembly factor BamB